MKLDILKIGIDPILHFEVIARLKGLKRAADELNLSQPAITHSLRKLEESLGVSLCVRTRSHFALTESGKRLYEIAKEIKLGLRGFQSFLSSNEGFDGMFNIGIIDNIENQSFSLALSKTVKQFSKMKTNIQVYSADHIQDYVASSDLDVGLGLFKNRTNLTYDVVGEEQISYYISDKHSLWKKTKISNSDLKGQCVTWLDIISRNRTALEAEIYRESLKSPMVVTSYANNLHAAMFLLESGQSIVPFPTHYIRSRTRNFKVKALDSVIKPFFLKQCIVTNKDFCEASPTTRFFLEQVRRSKSM
jgi:DNA-binding transcriptional LysR family regulator